jgi:uncharacterized protein (UPF0264 family)
MTSATQATGPLMLASVADLAEAAFVLEAGVDVVDLKDPVQGALGAWPLPMLRRAVERHGGRVILSATVGDLPAVPDMVTEAARRVADTGVDIVKVGLFAGQASTDDLKATVSALGGLTAEGIDLVAVMMADQPLHLDLVTAVSAAGFKGVMLDTADKSAGSLRAHRSPEELRGFVARGRKHGLLTGLAGSLTLADIAPLAALEPDYLGFRGALCTAGRTSGLSMDRVTAVRQAMRMARSRATATAGKQVATG